MRSQLKKKVTKIVKSELIQNSEMKNSYVFRVLKREN